MEPNQVQIIQSQNIDMNITAEPKPEEKIFYHIEFNI